MKGKNPWFFSSGCCLFS